MKILLDTNIIIDNLSLREPHGQNAKIIFDLIAQNKIIGYVTTSSITDIYYVLRKTFNEIESKEKIKIILNLLNAIEVTKTDCFNALESSISDFEDALIFVCAEKENLNFIVTRDIELLKSPKTILPNKFLEYIGNST